MNKTNKKTKLQAYACVLLIMALLVSGMVITPNAANVSRTLYVGDSLNLTYSAKKVNWSTSNKAVVSLSATKKATKTTAKALKKGTAKVTAKDSSGKTVATCIITVKNHSLKLNKTSLSVKTGNTASLKVTSSAPASKIRWVSSNENIVSVSASTGTKEVFLTGEKAGTATITVKTGNVKKTCTVTVTKASSTSTGNTNTDTSPVSLINKYFASNPQYTKISDGNGSYDELNGHAGWQSATYTAKFKMTAANPYTAAIGEKYQYIWKNGSEFEGISWVNGIVLSFNDNTFQTGENCGVLRVLNGVPGSNYTWSSSNSNVAGIQVMTPDTSAVRINAKSSGSATVTCKIVFPNKETKTLTSKINVSDSIESKIQNGSVDMNSVMDRIANAYRNDQNTNWIPDVIGVREANAYGYTALGSYAPLTITYTSIADATKVNELRPTKYLNDPSSYIANYPLVDSDAFFYLEYQGHNDDGIQYAKVGLLSIPKVK